MVRIGQNDGINNNQQNGQNIAQMSNEQGRAFFDGAIDKGINIKEDAGNYYMKVDAQFAAAAGTDMVQVDSKAAKAILKALETGGRISEKEMLNDILPTITDGGRYGAGEAVLARLLLSANDDRKKVMIGGDQINLTNKAEAALTRGLKSFWGKLGAKARWGNVETKQAAALQGLNNNQQADGFQQNAQGGGIDITGQNANNAQMPVIGRPRRS